MRFLTSGTLVPCLLICALVSPLCGQATPPPPSNDDPQTVKALIDRINALEERVRQLEAEKNNTSSSSSSTTAPPPVTTEAAPTTPADTSHETMGGNFPHLQIRGFTDVSFHTPHERGTSNTFALGQFDLFVSSRISDHVTMLSEVNFEAGEENNSMGVDLERMLVNFNVNDYLHISAGRYHTAIGYYNTAYHHSSWLQTAADRPLLFAFEDGGGPLPIHNVGLTANGAIPSGHANLHWVAEVGNGRSSRNSLVEPVQNVQDENNYKALNFALYARPDFLKGLQIGASVYHDRLMPDGLPRVGQTIIAGYAVYQGQKFEWLNELMVLRHAVDHGPTFNTPAGYTLISRQWGQFRPYLRYQFINSNLLDPIFPDLGLRDGPGAGVRYDLNAFTAFKIQYDYSTHKTLTDYGVSNIVRAQAAFTF